MSEEEKEEMRSQFREEIADYDIWIKEFFPKMGEQSSDKTNLLLFNINNKLGRIADSLEGVAEHFDFVDNKKIT